MKNGLAKVVVGISGGVDSAVAALRLQQQGYDVHGVFMKNWSEEDFGGPCPWEEDQASAQAVARHLNIPVEAWNFEQEYRDRVFKVMIHEYEQGRTPNPDILCNREIKFSLFLEKALLQAPMIATGHYAITQNGKLFKAKDSSKDQSYFLAAVSSEALKKTMFPLGELLKGDVRKIAKDAGLPNWDRPDSVGICFVGEKKMTEFLGKYIPPNPGPIVYQDTEIGRHHGLQFFTIGQRHGFGSAIDQKKLSTLMIPGQAVFVTEKNVETNTLVIAAADKPEQVSTKTFMAKEPHWIHRPDVFPWHGSAKLRYRQADVPVKVEVVDGELQATCDEPQRAVTPGQYAVFYEGDECLGSAVIDRVKA